MLRYVLAYMEDVKPDPFPSIVTTTSADMQVRYGEKVPGAVGQLNAVISRHTSDGKDDPPTAVVTSGIANFSNVTADDWENFKAAVDRAWAAFYEQAKPKEK